MSGPAIVWLVVGVVSAAAVLAVVVGLVRHVIVLARALGRFQREVTPLAEEIRSTSERAARGSRRLAADAANARRTGPAVR